ncbi:MAG: YfhO family protein, partial [Thermoanaerobaculia bacterium]
GEPALAAAGCAGAFAVALFAGADGERDADSTPRAGLAGRLALPFLLGAAVSAAALVPFAAYVGSSERRGSVTREEALARAVGPSDLSDLVAGPRDEATRAESAGRGAYLVTLAFGPLPLLLAAGAGAGLPGRRKLLAALAALAFGALLLSLGRSGGLAPLLYDTGILRGLRYPARWFVFVHLVLALAAGAGLDGWLWGRFGAGGAGPDDAEPDGFEARESAARRRTAWGVLAAGLVLLGGLSGLALLHAASRASREPFATAIGAGAAAAGAAILALSRLRSSNGRRGAAAVVAVLAIAPLPFLASEPLAAAPAAAVRSVPSALSAARGPEAGRVFAPAAQDRSLALRWRYSDGAGWSPAGIARASEALAGYGNLFHGVATPGSASPLGNPRVDRLVGAALAGGDASRILALLNVRQVLSPFPPRIAGLRHVRTASGVGRWDAAGAFGRAWFPESSRIAADDETFESLRRPDFDPGVVALVAPEERAGPLPPGRPRGSWAAAHFLADEPERAEIATSASAPSLLVLTRSWDAGWEARLDGTPVPLRRAQLALLAVDVPAGEHRLELRYRPLTFRVGLGLSAAGLAGLLALAVAAPLGRRRA